MRVPLEGEDVLRRGTPQPLFSMAPYYQDIGTNWAISPDGQRFLMIRKDFADQAQSEITVVQNWFEEVIERVPTDQ